MANPSLALLMPNLNAVNESKARQFLVEIDKIVPKGTLVILDDKKALSYKEVFSNIRLIQFSHAKNIGDTLRTGLAAAVELGAEKVVTFENYSIPNAKWFLPYVDMGNVTESKRRNFVEMVLTEITNILSFNNAYNGFSMNRIFTKEAASAIKNTKRNGKEFLLEMTNALNANGIKTIEMIKKDVKKKSEKIKPKEMLYSVTKSFNKFSILFSIFGFLTYLVNISAVYISLSIGAFYPLAIFLGGELSAVSNFMMNEKINFKNKGFLSSAYRLGKFNALILIPLVFDILFVGYLAGFTNILGKTLVTDISVIAVVAVSAVSFFVITKMVWAKENNIRVVA
jgi:putative flippase GtrA